MKTYVLFLTLYLLILHHSSAEIKNGYGTEINGARESLQSLKVLLMDNNLSIFQKISIKTKISELVKFITYYELTEKLLEQFKTIAPDLYYEIDTLTDCKGRPQHVYVKFIPETEMPGGVAGTTNIAQDNDDENTYTSEYGAHTVSIRIAAVKKSLVLLAHEFGHVKYQVPNLLSYVQFYSKYYLANTYKAKSFGHNDNDPSGESARVYVNRFREKYLNFLRIADAKVEPPIALLQEIKTQLQ